MKTIVTDASLLDNSNVLRVVDEESGSGGQTSNSPAVALGTSEGGPGYGGVLEVAYDEDVEIIETEKEGEVDPSKQHRTNFASEAAGAVIMGSNPEMTGVGSLLAADGDSYALSRCDAKKFVTIGLSEDVMVDTLVLTNEEKYSSSVQHFRVLGSQKYPASEWVVLGNFTAANRLGEQSFPVAVKSWVRYVKISWLSHYGNEFYCTWTRVRVHGSTMLEDLQNHMFNSEAQVNLAKAQIEERRSQQQQQQQQQAGGPGGVVPANGGNTNSGVVTGANIQIVPPGSLPTPIQQQQHQTHPAAAAPVVSSAATPAAGAGEPDVVLPAVPAENTTITGRPEVPATNSSAAAVSVDGSTPAAIDLSSTGNATGSSSPTSLGSDGRATEDGYVSTAGDAAPVIADSTTDVLQAIAAAASSFLSGGASKEPSHAAEASPSATGMPGTGGSDSVGQHSSIDASSRPLGGGDDSSAVSPTASIAASAVALPDAGVNISNSQHPASTSAVDAAVSSSPSISAEASSTVAVSAEPTLSSTATKTSSSDTTVMPSPSVTEPGVAGDAAAAAGAVANSGDDAPLVSSLSATATPSATCSPSSSPPKAALLRNGSAASSTSGACEAALPTFGDAAGNNTNASLASAATGGTTERDTLSEMLSLLNISLIDEAIDTVDEVRHEMAALQCLADELLHPSIASSGSISGAGNASLLHSRPPECMVVDVMASGIYSPMPSAPARLPDDEAAHNSSSSGADKAAAADHVNGSGGADSNLTDTAIVVASTSSSPTAATSSLQQQQASSAAATQQMLGFSTGFEADIAAVAGLGTLMRRPGHGGGSALGPGGLGGSGANGGGGGPGSRAGSGPVTANVFKALSTRLKDLEIDASVIHSYLSDMHTRYSGALAALGKQVEVLRTGLVSVRNGTLGLHHPTTVDQLVESLQAISDAQIAMEARHAALVRAVVRHMRDTGAEVTMTADGDSIDTYKPYSEVLEAQRQRKSDEAESQRGNLLPDSAEAASRSSSTSAAVRALAAPGSSDSGGHASAEPGSGADEARKPIDLLATAADATSPSGGFQDGDPDDLLLSGGGPSGLGSLPADCTGACIPVHTGGWWRWMRVSWRNLQRMMIAVPVPVATTILPVQVVTVRAGNVDIAGAASSVPLRGGSRTDESAEAAAAAAAASAAATQQALADLQRQLQLTAEIARIAIVVSASCVVLLLLVLLWLVCCRARTHKQQPVMSVIERPASSATPAASAGGKPPSITVTDSNSSSPSSASTGASSTVAAAPTADVATSDANSTVDGITGTASALGAGATACEDSAALDGDDNPVLRSAAAR